MYRALVEAACFGAKAIVDRFRSEGVPVKGLIGLGGVAKKSPYICQLLTDTIGLPLRIARSEQTCALGAAMFAATAAGIYSNVESAMAAMGRGFETTYHPRNEFHNIYEEKYRRYTAVGKLFQNEYIL
jgi:L-ribulokinase